MGSQCAMGLPRHVNLTFRNKLTLNERPNIKKWQALLKRQGFCLGRGTS